MSRHLLFQALSSEVAALVDLVVRLQQNSNRLSEFLQIPPEQIPVEEESSLARVMSASQHSLSRTIERITTMLAEFQDYMRSLPSLEARAEEEAALAQITIPEEGIFTTAELSDPSWPIFRLLRKARRLLDNIQGYLQSRTSVDSSNSSNGERSRALSIADDPTGIGRRLPLPRQLFEYPAANEEANAGLSPTTQLRLCPPIVDNEHPRQHQYLPRPSTPRDLNTPPSRPSTPREDALRVNRIDVPRFGGAPEEWTTFWAAFEFAVHSRNYRNFQKHLLLLQYLEKGSTPRRMVEGYPPSDDNYMTVVGILKRKFGDERLRRDQLHAQLLHLKPAKNTLPELRQLQQEIDRICTQLDHLDRSNNAAVSSSSLVADIIKGKLPHAVVLDLVKMEREAVVPWDAQDVRSALATIVNDKEQADLCMRTFHEEQGGDRQPTNHKTEVRPRPFRRQFPLQPSTNEQHRPFETTRAFPVVQQAPQATLPANSCSFCNLEGHKPSQCRKFATVQARKKRLEEQGRCLRCLRQSHATRDCTRQDACNKCRQRDHHFLLCPANEMETNHQQQSGAPPRAPPKKATGANAEPIGQGHRSAPIHSLMAIGNETPPPIINPEEETSPEKEAENSLTTGTFAETGRVECAQKGEALLMTQSLKVSCHGGPPKGIPAFVFYDPGSQTSYISKSLVEKLQPPLLRNQVLRIHTFADLRPKTVNSSVVVVRLQRQDGEWEQLHLSVIDEITSKMKTLQWHPGNTCASIPSEWVTTDGKPDILIGIREFWRFFNGHTTLRPGLHVISTVFGPMAGGELFSGPPSENTVTAMTVNASNLEAMPNSRAIEDFWSLEAVGIKGDPNQDDDDFAMRHFTDTVRQLPSGRYSVRLSWREVHPPLPNNWAIAYRRLLSAVRRFTTSPDLLEKYSAEVQRQVDADIIELTGRDEEEHFIPHQAVINPKKLRIVIDCSAHTKGMPSLNDCLHRGPVLLPDLCGLLLRFRLCAVPLLADVQAAFHAIEVDPSDRRFCKILWLKDPTKPVTGENLQIFRYKRLVFGATCSPFILAAVLLRHFEHHPSQLAKLLAPNTYVDNVLIECESEEEAMAKAKEAKKIFADADMNLREFLSHRSAVMDQLPKEDRLEKNPAKVLGLFWETTKDIITFKLPSHEANPPTRRSVLSSLSSSFDPLGIISPCLLPAKLLFQRLWEEGSAWDIPIPPAEAETWEAIVSTWKDSAIALPRQLLGQGPRDIQLHAFCDASERAFATAIYLLQGSETHLIFSKCRLRPKKASNRFTVPRLELMAILIGTRAMQFVEKELHRPTQSRHIWSDSRIALSWIKSGDPKMDFERRRVEEVRQNINPLTSFHFVRTEENPADLATRGCTPSELQNHHLWWSGPPWLHRAEEWPNELDFTSIDTTATDGDEEGELSLVCAAKTEPDPPLVDPSRFSSMITLLGTVIIMLRFIGRWRPSFLQNGNSTISPKGPRTGESYRSARIFLIREDQRRFLARYDKHPTIVNEDGLLCLKTRLIQANGPPTLSAPILLDRHSPLTKLLINEIHADLKHAGVDWTLTEFLGRYWIPQARRTIKGTLQKCPSCRRITAPPFARPLMPPLPSMRVQPANPFEFVGLDFAGPTNARDGHSTHTKTYIVIITCFVTRAVYLDSTRDLSASTFINVLRRFISRRGRPSRILSDNAPTFVQTHKALDILTGPSPETTPRDYAARKGIQWDFIPAYSPWMGACYERLIGLVKSCVMKTIGRRILDYDDLSAFLAEIEASINSRPITWVSDLPSAPKPLTPKDLIQPGLPNDLSPSPSALDLEDDNLSSPERLAALWKSFREAADHFWLRWSREYLLAIRERAGWTHKGPRRQVHQTPRLNQVVLVEEDLRPRNLWPTGVIVALNGRLPDIRSVQVRMGNGKVVTRPVSRLCPLETDQVEPLSIPPAPTSPPEKRLPLPPPPNQWQSGHPMMTRRKKSQIGTATTVTLLCLAAIATPIAAIWPLSNLETPKCADNHLNCTQRGIRIHPTSNIEKVTICCMHICFDRMTNGVFTYELTPDILINDYNCAAWFWSGAEVPCTSNVTCTAIEECELIECMLCLEQVVNWHCNPRLASAIVLGILFFVSAISGWIFCCCSSARIVLSVFIRFFASVLSWPIRGAFQLAGRPWTSEDKERLELRVEESAQRVRRNAERGTRRVRQHGRRIQRAAARWIHTLTIVVMITRIDTETISITTSTENCRRTSMGLECTVSSATLLTLLPASQITTLHLRNPEGTTLGTVEMRLLSLDMACHQRSEAWLRSYTVEVLSVKRCPRAGSCRDDHCSSVRPQTSVHELSAAQRFPGNTFCQSSTSFWGNDCALPTSSCLYHRFYARPTSPRPLEMVSCPSWDLQLRVHLRLEAVGGPVLEDELTLHPGMTTQWANVSLTPLAISVPPLPLLGSKFIHDGRMVARVDSIPLDLHCPSEGAATSFNCSLSLDACPKCFPNHAAGSVDCDCRDLDLGAKMADPEHRLPITTGKVRLYNEGPAIFATHVYSPVQLHMEMKNVRLLLHLTDSKCWLKDLHLHGCYRCSTGAQFSYTCYSDHDFPLATVKCDDGQLFVAHCSPNGTHEQQILPYGTAEVETLCHVTCSAGTTHFRLNGTLNYIPRRRQFGHHQRTSEIIIPDPETYSFFPDLGFDIYSVAAWVKNGPFILNCIAVTFLALVLLYLCVQFTPFFRAYRVLNRAVISLTLLPQICGQGPEDTTTLLTEHFYRQAKKVGNFTDATSSMIGFAPAIAILISLIFILISLVLIWVLWNSIPRILRPRRRRSHKTVSFALTTVIFGLALCPAPLASLMPVSLGPRSIPSAVNNSNPPFFRLQHRGPTFLTPFRTRSLETMNNRRVQSVNNNERDPEDPGNGLPFDNGGFRDLHGWGDQPTPPPSPLPVQPTPPSRDRRLARIGPSATPAPSPLTPPIGGFGSPRRMQQHDAANRAPAHLRTPTPRPLRSINVEEIRADIFLTKSCGQGWWRSPTGRMAAERQLSQVEIVRKGKRVTWEYLADRPALAELICPTTTVADFWRRRAPLERPDLPPLVCQRGIRGTSAVSIRKQLHTGKRPWNHLMPHKDYLPLEQCYVIPSNDRIDFTGRTPSPPTTLPLHVRFNQMSLGMDPRAPQSSSSLQGMAPSSRRLPPRSKPSKPTKSAKGYCGQEREKQWGRGPPRGGSGAAGTRFLFIVSLTFLYAFSFPLSSSFPLTFHDLLSSGVSPFYLHQSNFAFIFTSAVPFDCPYDEFPPSAAHLTPPTNTSLSLPSTNSLVSFQNKMQNKMDRKRRNASPPPAPPSKLHSVASVVASDRPPVETKPVEKRHGKRTPTPARQRSSSSSHPRIGHPSPTPLARCRPSPTLRHHRPIFRRSPFRNPAYHPPERTRNNQAPRDQARKNPTDHPRDQSRSMDKTVNTTSGSNNVPPARSTTQPVNTTSGSNIVPPARSTTQSVDSTSSSSNVLPSARLSTIAKPVKSKNTNSKVLPTTRSTTAKPSKTKTGSSSTKANSLSTVAVTNIEPDSFAMADRVLSMVPLFPMQQWEYVKPETKLFLGKAKSTLTHFATRLTSLKAKNNLLRPGQPDGTMPAPGTLRHWMDRFSDQLQVVQLRLMPLMSMILSVPRQALEEPTPNNVPPNNGKVAKDPVAAGNVAKD